MTIFIDLKVAKNGKRTYLLRFCVRKSGYYIVGNNCNYIVDNNYCMNSGYRPSLVTHAVHL